MFNIFGKLKHGMFDKHFIRYYTDNKKDVDAFETFYQYRVGAVALASLLGYEFNAQNDRLTVTDPKTQKSCDLLFKFSQEFDTPNAEDAFSEDSDSLMKFSEMMSESLGKKMLPQVKFECLEEAQCYLANYLKNSLENEFEFEKMKNLAITAQEEIDYARLTTPSVDMDIVLASASDFITSLSILMLRNFKRNSDVSLNEIIKEQHKILAMQMQKSMGEREIERGAIFHSPRREKDTSYWGYKSMINNISNCPEMW